MMITAFFLFPVRANLLRKVYLRATISVQLLPSREHLTAVLVASDTAEKSKLCVSFWHPWQYLAPLVCSLFAPDAPPGFPPPPCCSCLPRCRALFPSLHKLFLWLWWGHFPLSGVQVISHSPPIPPTPYPPFLGLALGSPVSLFKPQSSPGCHAPVVSQPCAQMNKPEVQAAVFGALPLVTLTS